MLLQTYGLEEVCSHHMYDCFITHYGQELPKLVSWRPFPGMKIDIRVDILGSESCELEADSLLQTQLNATDGTILKFGRTDSMSAHQVTEGAVTTESLGELSALMQTSITRVPRASDLDPMIPLRSVHTWHGSFLVPTVSKDQVRIGVRMIMPGSLEMLAAFDFLCWGIVSMETITSQNRLVLLREGRWDEQFVKAAADGALSAGATCACCLPTSWKA